MRPRLVSDESDCDVVIAYDSPVPLLLNQYGHVSVWSGRCREELSGAHAIAGAEGADGCLESRRT